MAFEDRMSELEKKNAVLEYRVQEQHESLRQIRPQLEQLEKMIQKLIENPYGAK